MRPASRGNRSGQHRHFAQRRLPLRVQHRLRWRSPRSGEEGRSRAKPYLNPRCWRLGARRRLRPCSLKSRRLYLRPPRIRRPRIRPCRRRRDHPAPRAALRIFRRRPQRHARRHVPARRNFSSEAQRVTLSDCHGPDLPPGEDPPLAARREKRHRHRLRRRNVPRARHRPVGTLDEKSRAGSGDAPRGPSGLAQRKPLAEFFMIRPDFGEFQRLAKQGNLIPVYDVFSADLLTPVSAYLRIAQGARYSFLLESGEGGEKIARYTFAGAHPEEVFRYASGACVMEGRDRGVWEERDPVSFLRTRMERFRPVRLPGLPPLVAGAIGYFSYDMVRLIEHLPKRLRDDIGLYDAMLMFYHGIIAFDHVQHRLWIVRNVFTEGSGSPRAK